MLFINFKIEWFKPKCISKETNTCLCDKKHYGFKIGERKTAGQKKSETQLPERSWPDSTRDDQNVCSLFRSRNTLTLLPDFKVMKSAVCVSPRWDLTSLPFQVFKVTQTFFSSWSTECIFIFFVFIALSDFSREDVGNVLVLKQYAWNAGCGLLFLSLVTES